MSQASINRNLFVGEAQPHKDQGLMDIGKHCHKCQQLDFLPFHCEFCNLIYCSSHRTLESHQCPGKPKEKTRSNQEYQGPTAASLFPDREKDKLKLEKLISEAKPRASNILGHNNGQGNVFAKFTKFLKLQKDKKKDSGMGLFKKKSAAQGRNKVLDAALLCKQAKGDPKVADTDKIYLWCLYINPKLLNDSSESDIFTGIDIDKEKKPAWISKQWPVGRALDSIADNLKISNYNNSTRDSQERLCIFKVNGDDQPLMVENGDRCLKAFKTGDVIYLVRGSI